MGKSQEISSGKKKKTPKSDKTEKEIEKPPLNCNLENCHLQYKDNSCKPDQNSVKITEPCRDVSDRHLVGNFKIGPKRKQINAATELVCGTSEYDWSL